MTKSEVHRLLGNPIYVGDFLWNGKKLSQRFEDVVRRIQIPSEVADAIAETLRTSQAEKERFHRTAVMQLQQRDLAVQTKIDRAYEDRWAGNIPDEMWTRKSKEWQGGTRGRSSADEPPRARECRLFSHWVENSTPTICSFGRIRANKPDLLKNSAFELRVRPWKSFSHIQ